MATSDERREVAATLRDAKRKCESRGYPWMCDDLCLAIGYEHDYEADNGIFDRLADLIDPTCEAAYDNPFASDFNYRCMACGEHFSTCGEPRYCPGCGRRIEHVK